MRLIPLSFDGIVCDEEEIQKLIQAARTGPLVLCPSHRSHIDYLVLSYLLLYFGMAPPHIAAGKNLSFFPMGPVLRRGGAFFMRRSFRGDPLYTAVFKAYLSELVRIGISIEFFIEGTRSRTGKNLMPRLGLLSMLLESWRYKNRDELLFVPISIDYDKIIEATSYKQELGGSRKKQENFGGLLRSTQLLLSKFGRVYLQFGQPISLKQFAAEQELVRDPDPKFDSSWRDATKRLGFRIAHQIASLATVTPTSVVAVSLLSYPGRGITQTALLERSRIIIEYLKSMDIRFSAPLLLDASVHSTLINAADTLVHDGAIEISKPGHHDDEHIYRVKDNARISLDFHKNGLINHFASASIVCRCVKNHAQTVATHSQVLKSAQFLSHLFKKEFLFPPTIDFTTIFENTLQSLLDRQYLEIQPEKNISILNTSAIEMLSSLLDSFLEVYWLTVHTIQHLKTFPLWREELINRALEQSRRAFLTGNILHPESTNKTMISSAIDWLIAENYLETIPGDKRATLKFVENNDQQAQELQDKIRSFLPPPSVPLDLKL